jgi:hypothetical protein
MKGISGHVQVRFEPPGAPRSERVTTTLDGGLWGVYEPFVKVRLSPEDLVGYAGTYRSDELEARYVLAIKGGALTLERPRDVEATTMEAQRYDIFTVPGIGTVTFQRADGISVDAFVLSGDRVRNLRFVRE